MARREVWRVRDLADHVAGVINDALPHALWVRGEISGYKVSQAGHSYFQLADREDPGHTFPCVLWAKSRTGMEKYLRRYNVELRDGVEVELCGRVSYSPRGAVQLSVTGIDPQFTAGRQAVARDMLLRDLRRTGLLERNKARALAPVVMRLGLVTAGDSAAYHDVLGVLSASGFGFSIVRADTLVQGAEAPTAIAAAIDACNEADVELILLTRGGGSRSDLSTFDTREVALAIAQSKVPVWCGVGHDVDRSVADEVAHRSFPTPTALASSIVQRTADGARHVESLWTQVHERAQRNLHAERDLVVYFAQRCSQAVRDALSHDSRRLDRAAVEIHQRPLGLLTRHDGQLAAHRGELTLRGLHTVKRASGIQHQQHSGLVAAASAHIQRAHGRLDVARATCEQADPTRLAQRGWTYATVAGSVIKSVDQLAEGEIVRTHLSDGWLDSRVITIESTRAASQPHDRTPTQQ